MRTRDTFDAGCSLLAVMADAAAFYLGFMLAVWVRFDSGWIPLVGEGLPPRMMYVYGGGVATLLCLFIFRALELYRRPQFGRFEDKIPRLVRASGWGILLATALAFIIRTDPPFSRAVTVLAFFSATFLVVLERYILFRLELHWARHREEINRVMVVGTDAVAARLKQALKLDPRLRSRVIGFLRTTAAEPDPAIPSDQILGGVGDLEKFIERGEVDGVILADTSLPHSRMTEIILHCERGLVHFQLVPDLFAVLTSRVQVQHVGDVPLLSVRKWPLDYFWNRVLKRAEDIAGSVAGLALSVPIIAVASVFIKRSSPGPIFFRQERCGEGGRCFNLFKLRTMRTDAEVKTGPVWAREDDPRRTRFGTFLRRYNLDELPQFWNVLKGDMSLVGPRPERLVFVEQFKEDVGRYMWRHVHKPGLTGWAQVNGLRGNTSIRDRIQYDLFYLENWSLALDFKILLKTFAARKNAY
ncbi:MAG: undecaprenyl-phosphate glucose phosphotransferase [Verrucomicrobia bacterium]|nr:undecaprenyl-phosphate glucose phosphotransferase [Verrucomicrobiota bacterium]MBU1909247.1 undecaprenyl-phosphate glucose phosphotransferase [Verrucomicrobiota bacterium]